MQEEIHRTAALELSTKKKVYEDCRREGGREREREGSVRYNKPLSLAIRFREKYSVCVKERRGSAQCILVSEWVCA